MKTKNALKQAELILKLYEIRRETALRTSRDYVGGEFQPKSVDEFVSLVKDGGKPSGHILQVYGYWDMVAAFVVHGALDESLIFRVQGPVNLQRLFHLYEETPRPDLKYPPFVPRQVRIGHDADSMFEAIRRQDFLLHHPYD